ncbi:hypothetical protein N431DRAFT_434782 [Stipitochalara longipes BDJ]|nr:hypothetical protein N431DRAFT_434782 [Stipitochalara longipes BDJ]
MWQNFLAPVGIWFHQQFTNSSEKTIKQYYEDISKSTLSKDLVDVLGKLVDNHEHLRDIFKQHAVTDEDGVLHWKKDSFKKWVTTNQPHPVISAFLPTLWRVFIYFTGFPFTEPILNKFEGPAPQHRRIDEDGFVQAYILLALRGIELLGNTKNGWTPRGDVEKNWSRKSPRLARLMFDGLKISSTEVDERFQGLPNANHTDQAEEQLMNSIALTQPEPYMTGISFEQELREVARRLLADNVAPNYDKTSSFVVSKHDLQIFVQLFLLLRIGNVPWTRGLILHETIQMCGDIETLAFVSNQEEILLSARLANALIQYMLGNIDSITWQSFETFFMAYPNIVLRFYQVWTAMCVVHPTTLSSQNPESGLLNCVFQFLSLIGPVAFDSSLPAGSGFNEDERQLQLDLQNATLVVDSISTPALDESRLVERLTNNDWFHILILSTEEAHETSSMESTERLITLFTSPHHNQMVLENSPGFTTCVWRYGIIQLLPNILMSQTGGLSASFQHDAIKFFPHNNPSHESSSVTVDLKNDTVIVEWTGSSLVRLKLKGLKCYQLPGTAVKVRASSKDEEQ